MGRPAGDHDLTTGEAGETAEAGARRSLTTVEEGHGTDSGHADAKPFVDVQALSKRLGRYQLVMPLAQGGMGLVFAGRLLGAHGVERLVAIKTLRPITSANDRAALLREARLTSKLHHRNIVATLDLGEVDDVPYVVMELVDGVAMSRLLHALQEKKESIDVDLAVWIIMQAANGLHAAHELTDANGRVLDLVHRDVSPQNILLSMSGDVKIADFGIAKFAGREESTATGMIKGKFGYMAPEQASASEVDRRSDVFALGIVLWEALVQEKLFSTDTPARTILRVLEHSPKSPTSIRPAVDETISNIVMRCLEKDPTNRFSSAADLAEALRSALRTRKAAVDEGDLALAVKRFFGEERQRTMDRLRNTPIHPEGTTETTPLSPLSPAPADASAIAMSLNTPRPRANDVASSRSGLLRNVALAGGAAALVAIVYAWQSGPAPVSSIAASTASTATTTASLPTTAPSASASASAPVLPTSSSSSSSTPAPVPTTQATRLPTPRASAPLRASASASQPPPPAVVTATTKPITSGRPFESL